MVYTEFTIISYKAAETALKDTYISSKSIVCNLYIWVNWTLSEVFTKKLRKQMSSWTKIVSVNLRICSYPLVLAYGLGGLKKTVS